MKVWDGQCWSIGFKDSGDPLAQAEAVFEDGKTVYVPNLLEGDLAGKGLIQIDHPKPATKKSGAVGQKKSSDSKNPPLWEGTSEAFGRLRVGHKVDSEKNTFSCLIANSGQLTQCSAKSVKYQITFGDKVMTEVGERAIRDNLTEKSQVVACRDQVRAELQQELDSLPMGQAAPTRPPATQPRADRSAAGAAAASGPIPKTPSGTVPGEVKVPAEVAPAPVPAEVAPAPKPKATDTAHVEQAHSAAIVQSGAPAASKAEASTATSSLSAGAKAILRRSRHISDVAGCFGPPPVLGRKRQKKAPTEEEVPRRAFKGPYWSS